MKRLRLTRGGMACGIVAVLLCSLCPTVATAQSVRGFGQAQLQLVPGGSTSHISVHAWLNDEGVAQGTMTWIGGVSGRQQKGGPSDPWFMDVTDLFFDGNTAYVIGVVTHSVFPEEVGAAVSFAFTDNRGTGEPDEINGVPIDAGNITVDD